MRNLRWIGLLLLMLTHVAQASVCLPGSTDFERLDAWRAEAEACTGAGDCVLAVGDRLEQNLAVEPGGVMLERLRQEHVAADIDAGQRGEALAEQYRQRKDLPEKERAWLLARLTRDDAALAALAEDLPWAGLDRLQLSPDLPQPDLSEDQREAIFEDFAARCPEPLPRLLPEMTALALSPRWPIWTEIRQTLLALPEPPWAEMNSSPAGAHAELAFEQGAVERGSEWMARRAAVRQRHDDDLPEELLNLLDAVDRKLNWLHARAEDRPGEAVILALEAHTVGPTEIKLEDAAEAWLEAGGTTETFERLLAAWQLDLPARWRGWQRVDEPLPELSLSDAEGRSWTLADFDGQRTLVNLWAVWCGPCREELPKVQALHERFADDADIRVVTINLDPNDDIALRFMAEHGYDFPVLLRGADDEAFNRLSLPRNWLVDGKAQRRWQQTGFNPDIARHWVDDAAGLLQQLD